MTIAIKNSQLLKESKDSLEKISISQEILMKKCYDTLLRLKKANKESKQLLNSLKCSH